MLPLPRFVIDFRNYEFVFACLISYVILHPLPPSYDAQYPKHLKAQLFKLPHDPSYHIDQNIYK